MAVLSAIIRFFRRFFLMTPPFRASSSDWRCRDSKLLQRIPSHAFAVISVSKGVLCFSMIRFILRFEIFCAAVIDNPEQGAVACAHGQNISLGGRKGLPRQSTFALTVARKLIAPRVAL